MTKVQLTLISKNLRESELRGVFKDWQIYLEPLGVEIRETIIEADKKPKTKKKILSFLRNKYPKEPDSNSSISTKELIRSLKSQPKSL